MSLPAPPALRHVMSIRFQTSRTVSQDHPEGNRYLIQVDGGTFRAHGPEQATGTDGGSDGTSGRTVDGTVRHGSDWVIQRADGSLELDVRVQLEAAGGTVVLMTYHGLSIAGTVRAAPRFSAPTTSALAWLNGLVCVAEGRVHADGVDYEVWAAA